MDNPFKEKPDFRPEWLDKFEHHILAKVLRILADVSDAKPTTADVLRAKANDLEKE